LQDLGFASDFGGDGWGQVRLEDGLCACGEVVDDCVWVDGDGGVFAAGVGEQRGRGEEVEG